MRATYVYSFLVFFQVFLEDTKTLNKHKRGGCQAVGKKEKKKARENKKADEMR